MHSLQSLCLQKRPACIPLADPGTTGAFLRWKASSLWSSKRQDIFQPLKDGQGFSVASDKAGLTCRVLADPGHEVCHGPRSSGRLVPHGVEEIGAVDGGVEGLAGANA